jgi:hypothetical protein
MSRSGRRVRKEVGLHRQMDAEKQVVDDGALLQNRLMDIRVAS